MMAKKVIQNPGDPAKSALLVIDVQRELFEKSTPIFKSDSLLENIKRLVDKAHAAGALVVYIQHNADKYLLKGSEGWQLHPALTPLPGDMLLNKQISNAFEGTELAEILSARRVGRLVAAGLVTHGCVKNTCLGGLERGYQVVLAGDAHSSFSKDAQALIQKWHTTLSAKGAEIKSTAEIDF